MEFGSSSAEGAGDVDQIADLGSGTEKSTVARELADGDDVGCDGTAVAAFGDGGRLGGVASGKRDAVLAGQGEEAVEEAREPCGGQARRDGEREEDGEGVCSHGGEVAEAAGEAAMADGFRRVPVATEVDALQGEVGSDADLLAGFGTEDGAIVANAEAHGPRSGAEGGGLGADGLDQGKFAGGAGW